MVLLLFFFFAVLAGDYGILAAVLAFSINFSNFAYAIIQSSFDAVGKEQMKAARTLGFTHLQSLRYVIIPQAFRIATPSSHVYITGANEDINKVFAMTGFNNLFEFR